MTKRVVFQSVQLLIIARDEFDVGIICEFDCQLCSEWGIVSEK
jgi:hypothetical protein